MVHHTKKHRKRNTRKRLNTRKRITHKRNVSHKRRVTRKRRIVNKTGGSKKSGPKNSGPKKSGPKKRDSKKRDSRGSKKRDSKRVYTMFDFDFDFDIEGVPEPEPEPEPVVETVVTEPGKKVHSYPLGSYKNEIDENVNIIINIYEHTAVLEIHTTKLSLKRLGQLFLPDEIPLDDNTKIVDATAGDVERDTGFRGTVCERPKEGFVVSWKDTSPKTRTFYFKPDDKDNFESLTQRIKAQFTYAKNPTQSVSRGPVLKYRGKIPDLFS